MEDDNVLIGLHVARVEGHDGFRATYTDLENGATLTVEVLDIDHEGALKLPYLVLGDKLLDMLYESLKEVVDGEV